MSLCASGTPCSTPRWLPFAIAASAASAAASAASASIAMNALRRGCHWAILSRQDCVASREEMRFSAIAFATDVSDIKAGSVFIAQPFYWRSWYLLDDDKRRGFQIERQRAGDRCKPFERRANRVGDTLCNLTAHGHAGNVSTRLDLFRRRSRHAASAPFTGARLWPEPGIAI